MPEQPRAIGGASTFHLDRMSGAARDPYVEPRQEGRPMSDAGQPSEQHGSVEELEENLGHPRGTLAIVILFGLLFALGWLAMYLLVFLERGAPHP